MSTQELSAVLCADWAKEFSKRSVYVADVSARTVRRVSETGWSVGAVLEEAQRLSAHGCVLAAFDVPLGVPESYLAALGKRLSEHAPGNFLEFLALASSMSRFFDATSVATEWSVERPFFSVPPQNGGLGSYVDAAARQGVDLFRRIDRVTRAKAVFVKSGIPGSVGSAACALWQELAPRLKGERAFKLWPFEGDLQTLIRSTPIVIGEIYPRAAYATALLDMPAGSRAPLVVAKTDAGVRRAAVASLRAASWVRSLGVTLENLVEAEASEDDFDACVTAAALLRCILDGSPLCSSQLDFALSEGGILGTGSVNLQLPQQAFGWLSRSQLTGKAAVQTMNSSVERVRQARLGNQRQGRNVYSCPIAGCDKIFQGSRGGWDGHVGSVRLHRDWHPELHDAESRKSQFEFEFPDFFRRQ